MKALRDFDIHIFKLSNELHQYQFEIGDSFFALFENEIVEHGKLVADISLDKTDRMIQLHADIHGHLTLTCDRSLEEFEEDIQASKTMLYKFGEEEQELSDDVMVIHKDTQTINIASILFEFILLEVPMKKIHPKFRDEYDEEDGELLVVYTSESDESDEEDESNKEEQIDPRWEKLKNLNK
jgi:uncharacterized protein